jgi:hypothetical protein
MPSIQIDNILIIHDIQISSDPYPYVRFPLIKSSTIPSGSNACKLPDFKLTIIPATPLSICPSTPPPKTTTHLFASNSPTVSPMTKEEKPSLQASPMIKEKSKTKDKRDKGGKTGFQEHLSDSLAPLKHCYTVDNAHLWKEDYLNWTTKAQHYFDTHHSEEKMVFPWTRVFDVKERALIEKYIFEQDSLPLHPDSQPITLHRTTDPKAGRFLCFKCGQFGSFHNHMEECGFCLPFEQTAFYFAWEELPREKKELLIFSLPRIWQVSALDEWKVAQERAREIGKEKDVWESKATRSLEKQEKQEKRISELEKEVKQMKKSMDKFMEKSRNREQNENGKIELLDDFRDESYDTHSSSYTEKDKKYHPYKKTLQERLLPPSAHSKRHRLR